MLRRASDALRSTVHAKDGTVGTVDDLLLDDESWTVRWVVIDTGNFLASRRVLLPPSALRRGSDDPRDYVTGCTIEQVRRSPPVEADRPVSRQMEASLYDYYGWAPYWGPAAVFGGYVPPVGAGAPMVPPGSIHAAPAAAGAKPGAETEGDPHLRSAAEITGYYIHAQDGEIGHVEDLLIDDEGWAVRYVVADTKNWWPGEKVLISPRWAEAISWHDHAVRVGLTREAIKSSPRFDPAQTIDRVYEQRLHGHYGFQPYWE